MSPPDTDIKKQERRHRPSLRGIAFSLIAVLLVILGITALGPDQRSDEAAPGAEQAAD